MGRSHPGYAPSASLAHDGLYEKAGAIWTKSSLAGAGNVPALVMSGRENILQPSQTINLPRVKELVIAGWTGRDVAAPEKHIRELEAIGVKRPKTTPSFYRVAASLLTNDDTIEALGDQSSGEAECVVYSLDDGLFVGVGSDYTDRKAEAVGVQDHAQLSHKDAARQG